MVLALVISCVGSSSGIGYCFGYWALSEEVAHLGKNIGHVVCRTMNKGLYTTLMFNVQL